MQEPTAHLILACLNPINLQFIADKNKSWVRQINQGICELNALIRQYNRAESVAEKKELFRSIDTLQQHIDDQLPDTVVSDLPAYTELFYNTLFFQLQAHRQQLLPRSTHTALMSDIIMLFKEMPPEKLARALSIFIQGKNAHIEHLKEWYEPNDLKYQILHQHRIKCLSEENSKIFLVEHIVTKNRCILKVDNRLNGIKDVERTLRTQLQHESEKDNFLVNIHLERRATFFVHGQRVTRALILMDYCDGLILEELAKGAQDQTAKIELAIEVGLAQLKLAQKTRQMNVVNTDYKGSNLFFISNERDTDWQIKVADCKAYCSATDSGVVIAPWDGYAVLSSKASPPEVKGDLRQLTVHVDPIHIYTTAKNMYEVLLADDKNAIRYSRANYGFNQSDFTADLFKQGKGKILADLMMQMAAIDPNARPSLDDAFLALKRLKFGASFEQTQTIFHALAFGTDIEGALVDSYIHSMCERLYKARHDDDLTQVLYEEQHQLFNHLTKLKKISLMQFGERDEVMKMFVQTAFADLLKDTNGPKAFIESVFAVQMSEMTQYLHAIIKKLRIKTHLHYFSQADRMAKAEQLERAICQLPLLERADIFGQDEPLDLKMAVRQALLLKTVPRSTWFSHLLNTNDVLALEYREALAIHEKNQTDQIPVSSIPRGIV